MANQRAAARAERQPLEAIVLPQIGRHEERLGRRRARRRADGDGADLLRGGEIALHQRRRHPQHAGDVVEPVAHIVGRQHRADVDVERQQIANRVAVLRAIESMKRFGTARIRIRVGRSIERGFEIRNQAPEGRLIRPRPAGRRHQVAVQFLDNLFPDLGIDRRRSRCPFSRATTRRSWIARCGR